MRKARQMPLTVQINCSYNVAAIVSDNATDLSINSPIFGYMGRHLCQTINNPPNINGVLHIQMDLRALGYTWVKVAQLLQISRSTLYRRLEDHGISPDDYSDITEIKFIFLHQGF